MKTSTVLAASAFAATAVAVPVGNGTAHFSAMVEDANIPGLNDYGILAYALTLELLEAAFYNEATKKFSAKDFANEDLYEDVLRLARDEQVHVDTLTKVLGSLGQPVPAACEYKFPYTSADEFLALAAIIEGVGVSAYSGAAPSIKNPDVLVMAGAILPIEARHDAILRAASGVAPYASPFDTPLDFNQVYTLASQFIVSCPKENKSLGLTPFPSLSLVKEGNATAPLKTGATIKLSADIDSKTSASTRSHIPLHRRHAAVTHSHAKKDKEIYAAFMTVTGPLIMEVKEQDGVYETEIPEGVAGQVYVILVDNETDVTDLNTLAGPAIVEVADVINVPGAGAGSGSGSSGSGAGEDDSESSGTGVEIGAELGVGVDVGSKC